MSASKPNAEQGGQVRIPVPPPPTPEQNAAASGKPMPFSQAAQTPAEIGLPPNGTPAILATAKTQAPAPQPTAQMPNGSAATLDENALVPTTVDGKRMMVPLKDVVASYQMRTAAEKRLAEANRLQNEHAGDLALARQVRAALQDPNPQAALRELERVSGRSFGMNNTTQAEDDGTDPALRDLRAKMAAIEARDARLNQFFAKQETDEKLQAIHSELQKYPLYQQDPGEFENAEVVVAAHMVKNPAMTRAEIADLVNALHERRSDTIQRLTTSERNQRAAAVSEAGTVPPSAGTPSLTTIPSQKPSKEDWQNNGWQRKLSNFVAGVTRGT